MTAILFSFVYLFISNKNLSITNAYQGQWCICWLPHNEEAPACCLSPLLVCRTTFVGCRLQKWVCVMGWSQ